MRIYLASRYSRREELCEYRTQLEKLGHTVTSRWLNGNHQIDDEGLSTEAKQEERERFAMEDFQDLISSEMLIAFTEESRGRRLRPSENDTEEWKTVEGFRLRYEVSSFGRVRNENGDIIAGSKNRGYVRVKPNGKNGSGVHVHKLVAELFLGPKPSGHEIDHKDGDKANNWVGNLEYVTHLENIRRAEANCARGSRAGENNGRAKLTYNDVCEIRNRCASGESKAAVSRDYGVSDVQIGNIVNGKQWEDRPPRGGANVEFGIAFGRMMRTWVVGPRENVFHCMEDVLVFENFDQCLVRLSDQDPMPIVWPLEITEQFLMELHSNFDFKNELSIGVIHDAIAAVQVEMMSAGRKVSSRSQSIITELLVTLEMTVDALDNCYNLTDWPGWGEGTEQEKAVVMAKEVITKVKQNQQKHPR